MHGNDHTKALARQVRVWDLFVRLFHWSLVVSISVAGLTGYVLGASWIRLHIVASVLAVALVALRIVWGFLGPTFARFSSFAVISPAHLVAHIRALRADNPPRHIGHNPLGGVMVMALMAVILALGVTGTMMLGGMLKTGPLADFTFASGYVASRLHRWLFYAIAAMVVAHLGGVIFESLRHRENLARSMLTGRKAARDGDVHASPRRAMVVPAVAAGALILGGSAWGVQRLAQNPPVRLPVTPAAFNPDFATECSDCHGIFHPSLLPAADWQAVMGGLENHYGEDASLDPETAAQISDWLAGNAAETADTRPAHLFTLPRPPDGRLGSITDTRAWHLLHDGALETGMFDVKSVGSRANCGACHTDADTGFFSPFDLRIPKE